MDVRKLRTLPKPKSMTPAGLMRGAGMQAARRRQRWTPAVIGDFWTRYWRTTPRLPSPAARTTPLRSTTTTTLGRHHVSAQHTAGYFSTSSAAVTNISYLTSTGDVTKQFKETRKSTRGTSVLAAATGDESDVTELDISSRSSSITDVSGTGVPAHITAKYPPSASTSSTHVHTTTSNGRNTLSDRQQAAYNDGATSLTEDSSSRAIDVTTLTSQHVASSGSRDSQVNGVDVKAHVAEAEDEGVHSNFSSSQAMTVSTSPGEMALTYLIDDGSSTDKAQVPDGGATQVNDAVQVISSDRPTGGMSDEDVVVLTGSSGETTKHVGTSSSVHDVTQVSGYSRYTRKTGTQSMFVVTERRKNMRKNTTSPSANNVDELSTSGGSGNVTNARGVASTWSTSSPGVQVTSPRRGSSAKRSSSSTDASTAPSTFSNDRFSLLPRRVLLKDVNSTGNSSTLYWSSQSTLPHAVVQVFLLLFVIAYICSVFQRFNRT